MTDRLFDWLEKEMPGGKVVFFCLLSALVKFAYMYAMATFLEQKFVRPSDMSSGTLGLTLGPELPFIIVWRALCEELEFRFAPLIILMLFTKNRDMILGTIIVSSIIFGFRHGSLGNILLQGVMGVVLSIVFLKCGGLHKRPYKALSASVCTHFFYNCIIFGILIAAGIKEF